MNLLGFADSSGWHVPLGTVGFIKSKTIEESWQYMLDKWGITHKEFRRLPTDVKRDFIKQVEVRDLVSGE